VEGFPSPELSSLQHQQHDTTKRAVVNSQSEPCVCKPDGSTELILQIAAQYSDKLIIVGISALTPLASALKQGDEAVTLLRQIQGVYLQGNVEVHDQPRMIPSSIAFNFREDMDAASLVFDQLQDFVPFTLVGKFSAYEVGITTADIQCLNTQKDTTLPDQPAQEATTGSEKSSEQAVSRPPIPNMTAMVKHQMQRFVDSSPDIFFKLYLVPEKYR
jgi:inosine-uridine nucleoside N-ribohydrolase